MRVVESQADVTDCSENELLIDMYRAIEAQETPVLDERPLLTIYTASKVSVTFTLPRAVLAPFLGQAGILASVTASSNTTGRVVSPHKCNPAVIEISGEGMSTVQAVVKRLQAEAKRYLVRASHPTHVQRVGTGRLRSC